MKNVDSKLLLGLVVGAAYHSSWRTTASFF